MKRAIRKSMSRRSAKTNAAGRRLMRALAELEHAAETGDFSKLSFREVEVSKGKLRRMTSASDPQ